MARKNERDFAARQRPVSYWFCKDSFRLGKRDGESLVFGKNKRNAARGVIKPLGQYWPFKLWKNQM